MKTSNETYNIHPENGMVGKTIIWSELITHGLSRDYRLVQCKIYGCQDIIRVDSRIRLVPTLFYGCRCVNDSVPWVWHNFFIKLEVDAKLRNSVCGIEEFGVTP